MKKPLPAKIERYQIIEELGSGGMGVVYKARDPYLDQIVALKILIASQFNPKHMLRFQSEAKTISQLKHPAFVKVLNFGIESGDKPFMVLEYVEGITLAQLIKEAPEGLSVIEAVDIAHQIARAMIYAHKKNVLHRDLKPSNIMMLLAGSAVSASIKIIDFGIAALMNQEASGHIRTPDGAFVGTPQYMSPEQAENKSPDQRSDIYSLGCIFFELVCGVTPFTGSPLEIAHKQKNDAPPSLRKIVLAKGQSEMIADEIERIIFKALEKEPRNRFSNMEAFDQALYHLRDALLDEMTSEEAAPYVEREMQAAALTRAAR